MPATVTSFQAVLGAFSTSWVDPEVVQPAWSTES